MKLVGRYVIRITGDTTPAVFGGGGRSATSRHYLLDRLLSGEEVDVGELASWGIHVTLDDSVEIERLNLGKQGE